MELTELQIFRRLVLKTLLTFLGVFQRKWGLTEQETKLISEIRDYLKVD